MEPTSDTKETFHLDISRLKSVKSIPSMMVEQIIHGLDITGVDQTRIRSLSLLWGFLPAQSDGQFGMIYYTPNRHN